VRFFSKQAQDDGFSAIFLVIKL